MKISIEFPDDKPMPTKIHINMDYLDEERVGLLSKAQDLIDKGSPEKEEAIDISLGSNGRKVEIPEEFNQNY